MKISWRQEITMLDAYTNETQQLAFVYVHTGLKKDGNNRIYAVAAAVIDMDKPKKEFHSLVRYSLMTARERYHSNISKEMLDGAPSPEDTAARLRRFLKGRKFVFAFDTHNAIEELQTFCGDIRIIDLSFAAEFFLPNLESYTPRRLWEYLSGKPRDKISFSATEITDLSIEFVGEICASLLNDKMNPRAAALRYYLKKSNTLFGEAFTHIARNYQKYFGGLFDPCTDADTRNWKQFLEKAPRRSREKVKKNTFKKISLDNLEGLYQGMSGNGYTFREEQVEYARHVADALNDNAVLTIEAGTGTGKTQGYLIPVLEFLRRNKDARVVISTYTKSLQEQIFQRELTFTKQAFKELYQDISVALLKGKSSYICAEKLESQYDNGLEGKRLLTWLYFANTVFHFRDADGDSVGEKIKFYLNSDFFFSQMLNQISARDGCTPKHTRCPAQVVTAEAHSARLVITNHHKLALLDRDAILSGLFRNYIIDEANHFENAVRSAFGEEVSSRDIRDIIRYLSLNADKMLTRAAGGEAKNIGKALENMDTVNRIIEELRYAFFSLTPKANPGRVCELQYSDPAFKTADIENRMLSLQEALQDIGKHLDLLKDPDTCRMLKLHGRTLKKMKTDIAQLSGYAESLKSIAKTLVSQDKVTTYQCFSKNWILVAQLVEVDELIRNHIYGKKDCIVYTAATLCHRGSFESFQTITGLNQPLVTQEDEVSKEFRFQLIPSPFPEDAMEIIIPRNAVSGTYGNKEAWIESLAAALPELIRKNRGRTLVLFASYSDLNLIAEKIAESVATARHPLLVQQQGYSTVNLCDEFREIKESVLFGVDTFWYGVDFKGDTLTQVVITRIPYPSPSDPIQMARKKIMSPKEFWKRYYYDTEIKMKQGIGRLIRCDTDRGRVMILDSRYRGIKAPE